MQTPSFDGIRGYIRRRCPPMSACAHAPTREMGTSLRAWASRQCHCRLFCMALLFLMMERCRADVASAAAAGGGKFLADLAEGSEDRITPQHPKAPPPPLPEDVPPNSTLFNVVLEQGEWGVVIEDDAPNSEASFLMRIRTQRAMSHKSSTCTTCTTIICCRLQLCIPFIEFAVEPTTSKYNCIRLSGHC